MFIDFDPWLMALSLLSCSIGTLITFSFTDRLYHATAQSKKILTLIFGLVLGLTIWANHILLSFAFKLDPGEARNVFPMMSLLAWGSGVMGTMLIIHSASKHWVTIRAALTYGFAAGMAGLAMYYFDTASIHGFNVVIPDLFLTAASTLYCSAVVAGFILLVSWLKNYPGKHVIIIKLATALITAFGIASIHAAFDAAFEHGDMTATHSERVHFMGIIIALSTVCAVLVSYILVLFYEKHGVQFFKFRLKDPNSEIENLEDSLTKLPNRRAYQQQLDNAAKRSNRKGSTFALAYIDLDHFKPVNDQYGHQVGDILLTKVAERLNAAVRGCDFVARIGGDEFVAIIEDIKSDDDARMIVGRIVKAVEQPFAINQLNIEISCSVGIAIYPRDGDITKLVVCADTAMYKAKESGKNQFKFYDSVIEQASEDLLEMQSALCLALEKNEFMLAFHPKIDCKTNLPTGAEALIRWNHPTKGELQPHAFIQAAERFGLINQINQWVVDECCRTIVEARKIGFNLNFSVNLSSLQFRNPNLLKDILKSIKFYDLDPGCLSFEIKETLAINNQAQFQELLDKFNQAGISVVLDDFGLHPISLNYLQDLHVDEIKLDRSFITNITQDKNSKALIDALIKLAHALGLRVVAEGVETEAQRNAVVSLGCDYMQGYLFSKPLSAENLYKLYQHLTDKQFQLNFEGAGQLSATDYQVGVLH